MSLPKISIVTTSFNQGEYLEHTIRAVLDQNYPNLEYIIIDGGSTDGSVDIIRRYEKQLAYWVSEKDSGMYDGIQKGLAKTTGEIMAWINSDDLYYPGSFSIIADIFTKFSEVEWLQGLPAVVDEAGRTVHVKDFRRWSKYNFFLGDYRHIQQESSFWRRSLWEKSGAKLDTSLRYAGDFELWVRFFDHARLHCVHAPLAGFRMRSKNQLSLEGHDKYEAECAAVMTRRLENLSHEERGNLAVLKRYGDKKRLLPFLRARATARVSAIHNYPPELIFHRATQSFSRNK